MEETNYFKQSFKYFKKKRNPQALNNVLNIDYHNSPEIATLLKDFTKENADYKCETCVNLGLVPHQLWHVFSFKDLNGFLYIRNPFTVKGQQQWIKKCLEIYPQKPSVTNLDLHHKDLNNIWSLQSADKCNLIDKLTWTTLGYHYNWDRKIYERTNYSSFPECLADLVKHIASCLHFHTFKPEAAIINYYNTKSTLGIHDDHSEEELNEPIISISFGLTAIFLVGTTQINEKPLPLFLKSGDIVILSGKSRLAYHAVPAVIREKADLVYCTMNNNDNEWNHFMEYMKNHRINMSVRQVYQDST